MKIITQRNTFKTLLLTLLLSMLTACGGGGGNNNSGGGNNNNGGGSNVDTTAPVITLIGDNPQTIAQGTTYTELGATAQDNVDGDVSANININASAVDSNTIGTYNVTYNVSDAAGNAAPTQTRTVNIVDPMPTTANIGFPTKSGFTDSNIITVQGTANDASGIANVEVNGISALTDDGYANWWVQLPLSTGNNSVSLKVLDASGNQFEDPGGLTIKRDIFWENPLDITLDSANNRALVLDDGLDALVSVDLTSGNRTIISDIKTRSGSNLISPIGITFDSANNRALIVDRDLAALLSIDLVTGNQTIISNINIGSGVNLISPQDVTLDSTNNRALIVDSILSALIAVDLDTGNRTVISDDITGSGTNFNYPVSIVFDNSTNQVLIIDIALRALIVVNLSNGIRTIISDDSTGTGPTVYNTKGLALDISNNRVLITDGAILAIDLNNGNRTIISNINIGTGSDFQSPVGIVVDNTKNRALVLDVARINSGTLVAVDLANGNRNTITDNSSGTGPHFSFPQGMAIDNVNNRLLGVERGRMEPATLIAVDQNTGNRTIISNINTGTGIYLKVPASVAFDKTKNRALVTDFGRKALIAVDLSTGNRSIISDISIGTGFNFIAPRGLALDSDNNRALVMDSGIGLATLIAVDLDTGNRTIISDNNSAGTDLSFPESIALDSINNRVLVVDNSLSSLVAIDLNTGNRTTISDTNTGSGINFQSPRGIALDYSNNRALLLDINGSNSGALLAVNLSNGNRTIISDNNTGSGINFVSLTSIILDKNNNRALVMDLVLNALVAVDVKPNPNISPVVASGDRIILSK